jgi:hypothetical protein
VSVASGTARSCYLGWDTTVGAYGGFLAEEARTNECLQARDLSNASWTKSNVTAAKDQAGIDGVANAASSLTATAANGTVKQSITSASAARRFSVFMKRITGTGNIDLTLDNGTTWTTVSGSINSATFTRVAIGQTVANPTVGIRIVASGDKIAVDMAQEELGAFDTSPIPTTTGSVTRNKDVLLYPQTGNIADAAGTAYAEATVTGDGNGYILSTATNVTNGQPIGFNATNLILTDTAGARSFGGTPFPSASSRKVATSWTGSTSKGYMDGSLLGSSAYSGSIVNGSIGVGIDNSVNQTNTANGTIKNLRIWTRALSGSEIAALSA